MKLNSLLHCSSLALALAVAASDFPGNDSENNGNRHDEGGVVFTMDNAIDANHVLAYRRGADGRLIDIGAFASGGRGTGNSLGSQGSLVLSENSKWLFVCNAGSDEISVFQVAPSGLTLTDSVQSGGRHPISIALHRNSLFVLNAGGQVGGMDNISGFLFFGGRLYATPNSTRVLSSDNVNPAQIGFSSDGEVLVVSEKDTSIIDTFTLDNDGSIAESKQFESPGQTPFGFAFRGSELIVSEAFGGATDASAASSYALNGNGDLEIVTATVPTTETSACWVVVSGNGRFAYTANTGSGTISGYRIAADGSLTLLNSNGVTGVSGAGSAPADMALSVNSQFLYSRNGNGTISAFRVNADGSLTSLIGVSGLPSGTAGLAGR